MFSRLQSDPRSALAGLLVASLVTAAPVAAGAAEPAASGGAKVGVQPTRGGTGLPEGWVGSLEKKLAEGLGRGDFDVQPIDAIGADACDEASCRAQLARTAGASYVTQLTVKKVEADYELTIELYGADGSRLVVVEGTCDTCGITEVESTVADQAATVRTKLDALRRGNAKIRFETTPPGARLYLDGTLIGTTPLITEAKDGVHRVTVEQKGYVTLEREITAVSGTQESITLELQTVPRSKRFLPWGVGTLIVGVVAAAAGGTLLLFHERPYQNTCTGQNVDNDGDCRLVYDTLASGAALTAAGGAAIITGAVLLGLSSKKEKKSNKRAHVRPGGVVVRF